MPEPPILFPVTRNLHGAHLISRRPNTSSITNTAALLISRFMFIAGRFSPCVVVVVVVVVRRRQPRLTSPYARKLFSQEKSLSWPSRSARRFRAAAAFISTAGTKLLSNFYTCSIQSDFCAGCKCEAIQIRVVVMVWL